MNARSGQSPAVGPGGRWLIDAVSIYVVLPLGSLQEPLTIQGFNFYDLGIDQELALHITDSTTGLRGIAFAQTPEPGPALLIGLGLAGFACWPPVRRAAG